MGHLLWPPYLRLRSMHGFPFQPQPWPPSQVRPLLFNPGHPILLFVLLAVSVHTVSWQPLPSPNPPCSFPDSTLGQHNRMFMVSKLGFLPGAIFLYGTALPTPCCWKLYFKPNFSYMVPPCSPSHLPPSSRHLFILLAMTSHCLHSLIPQEFVGVVKFSWSECVCPCKSYVGILIPRLGSGALGRW